MSDRSESSFEVNGSAGPFGSSEGDGRSSGLYAATAAAVTAPATTGIVAGGTSGIIPGLAAMSPFGDNAILGLFGPIADEPASAGPGGATELTADIFAAGTSGSFTYTDEPATNFRTCGCCAGFHFKPSEADGSSIPNEGAPGENGTLQQLADYLRVGYWATSAQSPRSWGAAATVTFNVQDLTAVERSLAREALSLFDDVANINFSEVSTGGQIVFLNDGSGQAFCTGGNQTGGLITSKGITISSDWSGSNINTGFNSYKYQTYIHEIGHALGLGHQGPYNNSATWAQRSFDNDSWRYSVMSYHSQTTSSQGSYSWVTGPQLADILAMQDMYGARTARTGDTVYGYNSNAGTSYNFSAGGLNGVTSFTIYDSGGTDTIDGSGYNSAQTFDLRTGLGFGSSVGGETNNIMIWGSSVVENAIGGNGVDTFRGNAANNTFTGNGGLDDAIFDGNRSTFNFAEGNGTYTVSSGATGTDTLIGIERMVFNDVTVVDDYRGGISTAFNLAMGGNVNANAQFVGDRDWLSVQLQAGRRYVIEERGSQTGNGTLLDPYVRLHNSAGTQITENDDGGFRLNSELTISVSTTGTYYVSAGQFGSNLGTYNLGIREAAPTRFQTAELKFAGFGASDIGGGWSSDFLFPRMAKDISADGVADLVGFGANGLFVATNTGNGYSNATLAYAGFGTSAAAGGWANNDQYTRTIANVNGDAYQDIVGFGAAGTFVALGAAGNTFGATNLAVAAFGTVGGWVSDDYYHRELADVNNDGRADIVGFGSESVFVSLGQAGGTFANATVAMANSFGPSAVGGSWSSDNLYPRRMADVNGDGRADIVGFGGNGVFVALAQATPAPSFAPAILALNSFGAGFLGGSWTSDEQFPRILGDINNDGRADIVGFGGNGTFFALGQAGGTFGPVVADLQAYGTSAAAGGWTSANGYPRVLADVSGDQRLDIVAFGSNGVYVSNSYDFINV